MKIDFSAVGLAKIVNRTEHLLMVQLRRNPSEFQGMPENHRVSECV